MRHAVIVLTGFVFFCATPVRATTFSVRMLTVKFGPSFCTPVPSDKVKLWADFEADVPAPDDAISIRIDGILLFAVPTSSFRSDGVSGASLLRRPHLFVRLDFDGNSLFVSRRKVDLNSVDPANGVDVDLGIGDQLAVENIQMLGRPGNRLVFTRADPG